MHENSAALGHQAREPSPEDRARVAHYVDGSPTTRYPAPMVGYRPTTEHP